MNMCKYGNFHTGPCIVGYKTSQIILLINNNMPQRLFLTEISKLKYLKLKDFIKCYLDFLVLFIITFMKINTVNMQSLQTRYLSYRQYIRVS